MATLPPVEYPNLGRAPQAPMKNAQRSPSACRAVLRALAPHASLSEDDSHRWLQSSPHPGSKASVYEAPKHGRLLGL